MTATPTRNRNRNCTTADFLAGFLDCALWSGTRPDLILVVSVNSYTAVFLGGSDVWLTSLHDLLPRDGTLEMQRCVYDAISCPHSLHNGCHTDAGSEH